MDELIALLTASAQGSRSPDVKLGRALVASASPLMVNLGGSVIEVQRLSSYSPAVGDTALLISLGAGLYVALGKLV